MMEYTMCWKLLYTETGGFMGPPLRNMWKPLNWWNAVVEL